MAFTSSLTAGQRAERKMLITVAEWSESGSESPKRVILGRRTEDSSIEFNADIETSTDILGINYSDINKTQPQQTFDPAYIIGGDDFMSYLLSAAMENNIAAYNGKFTVYIIAAWLADTGKYYAVKHSECSIIPESLGGESYAGMPFTVYFSNNITKGSVDKLSNDFIFTADGASV